MIFFILLYAMSIKKLGLHQLSAPFAGDGRNVAVSVLRSTASSLWPARCLSTTREDQVVHLNTMEFLQQESHQRSDHTTPRSQSDYFKVFCFITWPVCSCTTLTMKATSTAAGLTMLIV